MKDRWDKVSQSLVTSHSIIRRKGSAHMRGMRSFDSVPTCSGWGGGSHRAFLSAQDDDTGERVVSRGGGFAANIWAVRHSLLAFPIGEGARRADRVLSYERQMGKAERWRHIGGNRESLAANDKDFSLRSK